MNICLTLVPKIQDFNENVSTAKTKRLKCYFHGLGEKAVLMLLIWNLQGLEIYSGAPQIRNSLVITSFTKKSAWCEKKFGETQKCQNILPITTFENVEKMQSSHVLEAQIISTCRMALLFCSVCSLDTILHYTNLFGAVNSA